MDKQGDKDTLRQKEDKIERLKQQLMRANNQIEQLQRDNHRLHSVIDHIHGVSATENNSRNLLGLVVADSAGQLNATNTTDQYAQGGATNDEPSLNQKSECEPLNFERSWCEERKREIRSINDERRLRHRLCQVISRNARKFAMDLDVLHLLDQLISHDCITEEESREMRSLVDSTNLSRVILSLVLRRDCRTMLSFIDILFECDNHLTKFITHDYDNLMKMEGSRSSIETGPSCSHCLLVQRVEPILIIDFLISHDYSKWLPFYDRVVHCKSDVPDNRKAWWDDFMKQVNNDRTSLEMTATIIDALETCGFHSDIVDSMREDHSNQVNCFMCKLTHSLGENKTSGEGANESYTLEPRMHVLKEVDDENTNLKMIQDTTTSSTDEEHKMLKLKMFDLESGVETEYPTENRQGRDEHTNSTRYDRRENGQLSILFITNSDITITNKNSRICECRMKEMF